MSAPQLTVTEQKASISGKKKKKHTLKNVLNIPKNLKVESHLIEIDESQKLKRILERLLPSARLPVKDGNQETHPRVEAKNKRDQLVLGVNALTRAIKKKLVATVLLANDIQPQFLIHHLNLLCNYNKIPFLHISGLREITKNCLGFPCIALGFKKDFVDFSEAVKEIQTFFLTRASDIHEDKNSSVDIVDISESSDEEIIKDCSENNEPFVYLHRTSTSERIFIPEKSFNDKPQEKPEDFIKINKSEVEAEVKNNSLKSEISSKFKKQKRKFKNIDDIESPDTDEDLEMPKKKAKRAWVIDTAGRKQNIKYFQANLMKVSSNPDRIKKKK